MVSLALIDLLNIPALVLLGIVTSYEDLKNHKIRNKWILIAVIYSVVSLAIALGYLWLRHELIDLSYARMFFVNLAVSIGFGFFLWLSKLWSPGDAKLFMAYAALIPLSTYKWGAIGFFPAYILLINTFTPLFLVFLVRVLTKVAPKVFWEELKKTLHPKLILSFILFVFGFSFVTTLVFGWLGIAPSFILSMAFLLAIMILFTMVLKIDLTMVSIALCILRLIIQFNAVFRIEFLITLLAQVLFFLLAIYLVLNLGKRAFAKPIYVESLKPGMCLVEDIIEEDGAYKRVNVTSISFLQSLFEGLKESKSILSDYMCLTKADVEKINRLHSEDKLKEPHIFIHEKIGFALFMFIGAIITLIARGDVLFAIRALLGV
jgi:hypothetical protein